MLISRIVTSCVTDVNELYSQWRTVSANNNVKKRHFREPSAALHFAHVRSCLSLLQKRGEHIKNWRQRYFVLYENGYLMGFREKPQTSSDFSNPLNTYNLKNCQIMKSDSPKRFVFRLQPVFTPETILNCLGFAGTHSSSVASSGRQWWKGCWGRECS